MPSTTGPSTRNAATTLDRYFTLSDTAGHSQTDFEELKPVMVVRRGEVVA